MVFTGKRRVDSVSAVYLVMAYAADLAFGDPEWIPHPVQLFGLLISWEEKAWRRIVRSAWALRLAGILTSVSITLGVGVGTWFLLKWICNLSPFIGFLAMLYLAYTTLSARSLDQAAGAVVGHLQNGRLEEARSALARIVGRDTKSLDESEIVRGAIETLAENTSDGFVAPFFYLALGGVPVALAYKAINTLDSMIGYKNDRYRYFGWAAARLDDVANYVPARLTAILVAFAAFLVRLDWRRSLRIVARDARLQPSPNSGFPEAAYAGAMGIRLGGTNTYEGRVTEKAYIGDPGRKLTPELYPQVRLVFYVTSALTLVCGILAVTFLRNLPWP
jgi:adenosylcobinamide-phosphate synthase